MKIQIVIEVEVSGKDASEHEKQDLQAMIDLQAPEFVHETCGLVFGDEADYTQNTVTFE